MQLTHRRTALAGPDCEITVRELQEVLAELIDLTLQAKQAHWNVIGPRFRALHLQLDDLVAHTRRFSDAIAERIVTLGEPAQGTTRYTDAHSKLDPFPTTFVRDDEVVKLMVERLGGVCSRLRNHIEAVRERDPVSEDALISVLGTLEEQMWMFHAQAQ